MESSTTSPSESTSETEPSIRKPPKGTKGWFQVADGDPRPEILPEPLSVDSKTIVGRLDHIGKSARDEIGASKRTHEIMDTLFAQRRHLPGLDREDLLEEALVIERAIATTDALTEFGKNVYAQATDVSTAIWSTSPILFVFADVDLENIRVEAARRGVPILEDGDDPTGIRRVLVRDIAHFDELVAHSREAVGFSPIRNDRNALDYERIALRGIEKPALVAPVRYVCQETGDSAILLTIIDAHRRHEAWMALAKALFPGFDWEGLSTSHWMAGNGTRAMRPLTGDALVEQRARVNDLLADIMAPGPSGDPEIDEEIYAAWVAQTDADANAATTIRLLKTSAHILLGADDIVAPNPINTTVRAITAALHLPEYKDVEWEEKASERHLGKEVLRLAVARPPFDIETPNQNWASLIVGDSSAVDWAIPGLAHTMVEDNALLLATVNSRDDLTLTPEGNVALRLPGNALEAAVVVPAVDNGIDMERPFNRIELAAMATAAIITKGDYDIERNVKKAVQGRGRNDSETRSKMAAAMILKVFGLPLEGPDANRAFSAIQRSLKNPLLWRFDDRKTGKPFDPIAPDDPDVWMDKIGDTFNLIAVALDELSAVREDKKRNHTEEFGPAQKLLVLYAILASTASEAVWAGRDPHQVTMSGLGGRRGFYKGIPADVFFRLAASEEGLWQMWEIFVAASNEDGPTIARSVKWDQDRAQAYYEGWGGDRGDPRYEQRQWFTEYLTEADLRGYPWGAGAFDPRSSPDGATSDGTEDDVPVVGDDGFIPGFSAIDFVQDSFRDALTEIRRAAKDVLRLADPTNQNEPDPRIDPETEYGQLPGKAFHQDGVDLDICNDLLGVLHELTDATRTGQFVRSRSEN